MIEKASINDTTKITTIVNESNKEYYKNIISKEFFKDPVVSIDDILEDFNRMDFYLYKIKSKAVGVSSLMIKEDLGVICKMYVLPEYQNKGVGTKLMKDLEMKAKKLKLKKLRLLAIWSNNKKIIDFYEKFGFKIVEKIEREWAIDCIMEKELNI
ncbi:MAG: GNAT family N-acetyltransferase [Candidatus Thorarchaeota archaeon]